MGHLFIVVVRGADMKGWWTVKEICFDVDYNEPQQ